MLTQDKHIKSKFLDKMRRNLDINYHTVELSFI